MQTEQQVTYNVSPFWVGLRWPQRLAMLRHVQDVGVQFGSHGELSVEKRRTETAREHGWERWMQSLSGAKRAWAREEKQESREWSLARWKRSWRGKKGEDDKWDSRLRDTTLVLLPISLSRAHSEKDVGIIYWLGERRKGKELRISRQELQEHIKKVCRLTIINSHPTLHCCTGEDLLWGLSSAPCLFKRSWWWRWTMRGKHSSRMTGFITWRPLCITRCVQQNQMWAPLHLFS